MWLIDVKTRKLVRFMDSRKVAGKYAILSHTWEEDELTFSDGQNLASQPTLIQLKKGYLKVDFTCRQAAADKLRYAWVDTCCINQDSSAELSEAINSMFRWYQNAKICYVYLSDTTDILMRTPQFWLADWPLAPLPEQGKAKDDFGRCRWFTRGWTLQELLAPRNVQFFAKDWTLIGTKRELEHILRSITGISMNVIVGPDNIWSCSISERMSWAADRLTTREEDSAYCLLGIFNVNIPLLYGEGPRAFIRLQEEILRTNLDHSLLCWRMSQPTHRNELLAPDVSCFKDVVHLSSSVDVYDYDGHQLVSKGLNISLPIRPCEDSKLEIYAALNCSATTGTEAGYAILLLRRISREDDVNRLFAKRVISYEVIRETEEIIQPLSLWRNSDLTWRAGVSVETIVIVPHRASITVCFDYPEDRLKITEGYPEHCFIRRSTEFHFIPDRKNLGSDAQQRDCRVKLCDKFTGESQYLWASEPRTFYSWNGRNLHFRKGDLSSAPFSTSPMATWSLNNGATILHAKSWVRKDIPPGVYVIRVWVARVVWSDIFRRELSDPTASLVARWNRPRTTNDEPLDIETESISSLDSAAESN